MVNGLYFRDSVLYGEIRLETENKSRNLEALIDTGAFKTLVPELICRDLNLFRIDTKNVWGICPTPTRVNIYLVKVYFLNYKVIDTVIGFDIPSGRQISLIGRDILSQFNINIVNSDRICQIEKI